MNTLYFQLRFTYLHCVKSIQIRSFFWSVFSRIRTEYWEILRIRIQSKCGKIRIKKNSVFEHFRASNTRCNFEYPLSNHHHPLITAFLLLRASALIRIITMFYKQLNQNPYGTSIETMGECKYYFYSCKTNFYVSHFFFNFYIERENEKVLNLKILKTPLL